MNTQNKTKHLVVRISKEFKDQYKNYCDDNGYTISKRVLSLLKRDMNNEL